MGKSNQLNGVANNLAVSFVSVSNIEFVRILQKLPLKKPIIINLLQETIMPKDLDSKDIKEIVQRYKNWFLAEIAKLGVEQDIIKGVFIEVSYKSDKEFMKYQCAVIITANGKIYKGKSVTIYPKR